MGGASEMDKCNSVKGNLILIWGLLKNTVVKRAILITSWEKTLKSKNYTKYILT